VIQRGINDDQLLPLAGLARQQGMELRLIEYMDVGNRNQWTLDQVLPAAQMVERIHARWPLEPLGRPRGGTARRWRYGDGAGSIGVIASISEPFCGDCNRLRVTADGQAFTCLFSLKARISSPRSRRSFSLSRPCASSGSGAKTATARSVIQPPLRQPMRKWRIWGAEPS
jgi:cyclic pyranopterin phosphate synthase